MAMSIHHEPSFDEPTYNFIECGVENDFFEGQMLQKKLSYYSKSQLKQNQQNKKKLSDFIQNEILKIPTYEENVNLYSLPSDRTLNCLYKAGSPKNLQQNVYASFLSEKSPSFQSISNNNNKKILKKRRKRNFLNNVEKQHKTLSMPEDNYKSIKNQQNLMLNIKSCEEKENQIDSAVNIQKNSKKSQYYEKERSDAEIQQNGLLTWLENEIEEEKLDTCKIQQNNEVQQNQPSQQKDSEEDEEDFYQKKHQRFFNKMKISSILSQVMEKIEKDSPINTEKSDKNQSNIQRCDSQQSVEQQKNLSMNSIEESKNE